MAFNFGVGASQAPLFGAAPTTTASSFTGFGAVTTTPSTGFSFGGGTSTFGTPAISASTGFGTTAAPATGTPSGFNFGTQQPATGFAGFGSTLPATTTAATGFTGFGSFGSGTGTGFGTGAAPGFGTGSSFGTGGSLFGTGSSTFGTTGTAFGTTAPAFGTANPFGAQQAPQQQAPPAEPNALATIWMAVSLPQIYGDERDGILAKWNQLQAFWGTGKGFYNQSGAAVDFKSDNPFCRFKAIGYSVVPIGNNEDGVVIIQLKMKLEDVSSMQQQIVDGFNKLLPNKQTQSVCIEGMRPLPGDVTELVIYVLERPATGPAKRIPATDLAAFLNQPNVKSQLTQLSVLNILPKISWSPEQLKEYLATPPAGLDPLLWQQAKLDNPDPQRLIPVPMIGFKELHQRFQHQAQQTKLHQQRLDVMADDLTELQAKHTNMLAKLEEYKRKHCELSHRLLQVVVKQEICRKSGYAIQSEEEQLKVQLEALQVELNHPTQFKGRLNELMSQIRMQNQLASARPDVAYQMDENLQHEIKQMLMQQQEGLQHLIQIIKQDSENIQLMEHGLALEATRH